MRFLVYLICTFFCTALYASPATYNAAKELAERHEKSLSNSQIQTLTSMQGVVGGKVIAECFSVTQASKSASFALVMQLDATGTIVRTWLDGNSEGAKCFEKKMTAQRLFAPPFSPFYTIFEMNSK